MPEIILFIPYVGRSWGTGRHAGCSDVLVTAAVPPRRGQAAEEDDDDQPLESPMWQSLYERLRRTQHPPREEATAPTDDVTFFRAPPPEDGADADPRCPACPGVRLVSDDPEPGKLRCVWCTRVYGKDELAPSEAA